MFIYIIVLLFVFVYVYYKRRFNYWKSRGVPGPDPTIPFGNVFQALIGKKSMADIYTDIYNEYQGYPFVGIYKATSPVLLIRDPDFIKAVAVKDFQHFVNNESVVDVNVDPVLGRNPFFLKGEEWKKARAKMTPCFTSGKMKNVFPSMLENAKKLTNYIKKNTEFNKESGFELKDLASLYTINNVASTAFGINGKAFDEKDARFLKLAQSFFATDLFTILKFNLVFVFPGIAKYINMKIMDKKIEEELLDIVETTLKHREDNNISCNDFLDYIGHLKKTSGFTKYDVAAQVASFFLDGFETSSVVISFILFELACHPDVQDTLRKQIGTVCSKSGGQITFECFSEMPYLDAVIEETLRRYPVINHLNKVCNQKYTYHSEPRERFKEMTVTVEEGTVVALPSWSITHDPTYFENPNKFDPSRFLDGNYPDRYVYFPFGEGPRQCLGRRFGLLQAKLGVVEVIKNFEIRRNNKTKLPLIFDPFSVLTVPKGGVWVNFHEIK